MNYMPRLADLELLQFFAVLKMREIIGGFDMGLRKRQGPAVTVRFRSGGASREEVFSFPHFL